MASNDQKLLGTAARVVDAFGGAIRVESMYGPEGSKLYHSFTLHDTAEVAELLALSDGRSGPVLELACGSGRITLPLLKAGFEVHGLDNSPSMLSLLEKRLAEPEHAGLDRKLTTQVGDMTEFELGRTFELVLLGATAIWNLDEAQRASLFHHVREHLAEDGRFLMTFLTYAGLEERTSPLERLSVFTVDDGAGKALCTLIDYAEPSGIRSSSIVHQRLKGGAVAETVLYTAWTYLASAADLAAEVERAGLKVISQHEVAGQHRISKDSDPAGRSRQLFEIGLA